MAKSVRQVAAAMRAMSSKPRRLPGIQDEIVAKYKRRANDAMHRRIIEEMLEEDGNLDAYDEDLLMPWDRGLRSPSPPDEGAPEDEHGCGLWTPGRASALTASEVEAMPEACCDGFNVALSLHNDAICYAANFGPYEIADTFGNGCAKVGVCSEW